MTDPTPAFRQIDLSVEERAQDLLSRLTPEERIAMLHQVVQPNERLGLGEFHTGCEALHGAAWMGVATVFPQPVGLAATWDTALVERVAEVASTEVRAKRAEKPAVSLNVWAPVVNTLRHPGWGRNEEGYSEDPHLTGLMGAAYAQGLRGRDERVWRTVPALKHFLGYSNETDRSVTSSEMSLRTLHEEELPAFRCALENGVAGGMMLAYNRVNGTAAHTQPELVEEARSWAPGSIAVVSDAAAPTFLVTTQREEPDFVHGAAALIRAGLDSFTDNDANSQPTIDQVTGALKQGLLTMEDVDRAVLRVLELRVRTGEFDGEADPYAGITAADIDLPASRELARESVAKSVVVLRNAADVLPLAAPARIAVVGPLADDILTDWYAGTQPYKSTLAGALAERYPDAVVDVVTGADTVALRSTTSGAYVTATDDGATVIADSPAVGDSALFDVTDWGDGVLTFRSHSSGKLLTGGHWPLHADAERVGGWVAQESFRTHVHPDGTWSILHLGSGKWLRVWRDSGLVAAEAVTLDTAERFEPRVIRSGLGAVAAAAENADAVVVAVGNDPHLAGRETEDRPHLLLPAASSGVYRAARDANERTVLTVISSFPYVLDGDLAEAATVVWSSHGGQELGHGLVDLLSGDVEPYGRLAQSWPATAAQAGDLFDYDTLRQQATYRHQPGAFAFPFGHGLTYSPVSYEAITLATDTVSAPAPTHRHAALIPAEGDVTVAATVTVRNTGDRAAEELVQVYALGGDDKDIPTPLRLLVAFARVRLEPGETREVTLEVPVARLAVWDAAIRLDGAPQDWLHEGALRVQSGPYRLAAGASSQDVRVEATLTVG